MPRASSIRTQILIWNTLTLAAILVVLGLFVRQLTVRAMYGSIENELQRRIRPLLDGHPEAAGPPPNPPRNHRGVAPLQHRYDFEGQCLSDSEEPCAAWDADALRSTHPGQLRFTNVQVEGEPFLVLTAMYPAFGPPTGFVQVPYPIYDIERSVRSIDSSLLLLAPLALLVAALGGWAMAGRMLVPVRAIALAAGRIGGANLASRVPVRGTDEFAGLGLTINAMLERLEEASHRQQDLIEQQRRFTADASHELKTPLTTIKANAQLALSQDDRDGYRQSMKEVSRAAAVMDSLVQDLLLLARSDSGQLGRNRIEVLLLDALEQAIERTTQPGRSEVQIDLEDDSMSVEANEGELVRLFTNIIENARRFSPPEAPILVVARLVGTEAVVSVIDQGPGVPEEQLAHLGERFYRVDSSRTRSDGGSGLGLSICRGIVEAHGGSLKIANGRDRGLIVTVTL